MTSLQQRAELQRQIWAIANDVRGSVDGWDFKQYVLGTLFYRFISENFVNYITGGDESVNYAAMSDDDENINDGSCKSSPAIFIDGNRSLWALTSYSVRKINHLARYSH